MSPSDSTLMERLADAVGEVLVSIQALSEVDRTQIQTKFPETIGSKLARGDASQLLTGAEMRSFAEGLAKDEPGRQEVIKSAVARIQSALLDRGLLERTHTTRRQRQRARPTTAAVLKRASDFDNLRRLAESSRKHAMAAGGRHAITLGWLWLMVFELLLAPRALSRVLLQTPKETFDLERRLLRIEGNGVQREVPLCRATAELLDPAADSEETWSAILTGGLASRETSPYQAWRSICAFLSSEVDGAASLPHKLSSLMGDAEAWATRQRIPSLLIDFMLGRLDSRSAMPISAPGSSHGASRSPVRQEGPALSVVTELSMDPIRPKAADEPQRVDLRGLIEALDEAGSCMADHDAVGLRTIIESPSLRSYPAACKLLECKLAKVEMATSDSPVASEIGLIVGSAYCLALELGDTPLCSLGLDDWVFAYETLMQEGGLSGDPRTASRIVRSLNSTLRNQGLVAPVRISSIDGYVGSTDAVNTRWILEPHFRDAITILRSDSKAPITIRSAAEAALRLGYQAGPRPSEIARRKVRDLQGGSRGSFQIRGTVKTASGRRGIYLGELMNSDDYQELEACIWRAHSGNRGLYENLMGDGSPSFWDAVNRLVTKALREATGNSAVTRYDLRHSFGSRMFPEVSRLLPPTGGDHHLNAILNSHPIDLNSRLGRSIKQGSWAWQLAYLMGHSSPIITLRHYVHSMDLLLDAFARQFMPTISISDACAWSGLSRSSIYSRHREAIVDGKVRIDSLG